MGRRMDICDRRMQSVDNDPSSQIQILPSQESDEGASLAGGGRPTRAARNGN